ncbi:MAG: putative lipoprotein [Methylosarcina sp.]
MYSLSRHFNNKCFNAAILAIPLIAAGCSFSESSRSVSDSVESISDSVESLSDSAGSISKSSKSDKEKKYEDEISDYTMAYVKSAGAKTDYNDYLKGLSDIAAKRGIVNWDQESKTYIAIGKGLKKAGIDGITYETYKKNFGDSDQEKMQNIQKGYESEK